MSAVHPDLAKVCVTQEELAARVTEIAAQINQDYRDKSVVLVAVLKGAVMFLSDLSRELDIDFEMDFMAVSSYGNRRDSSGIVRIVKDLETDLEDRHVLIIEDILDTGLTLKYLMRNFLARGAKSVEIATCVLKDRPRDEEVISKYVGFTIPNEFVVGYGLDYAENYRGLPYIGVLKPEIYAEETTE